MEVLTKPRNALARQYGAMFDMYRTGLVRASRRAPDLAYPSPKP